MIVFHFPVYVLFKLSFIRYNAVRYLPPWVPFPGGNPKLVGKQMREDLEGLNDVPHLWVKDQLVRLVFFYEPIMHLIDKPIKTIIEKERLYSFIYIPPLASRRRACREH